MFPICLNRYTTGRGLPLPEFVTLASEAGFDGADVDLSYGVENGAEALKTLYESPNLVFGGWGPKFDWRSGYTIDTNGLEAFSKQAAIAATLNLDTCCTWIAPSSEMVFSQNWEFHVKRLSLLAKILKNNGLRLGLEFVSPFDLRRKYPHEFIFTPMTMLELAAEVGSNCGLLLDVFHLNAAGEPMDTIKKLKSEQIIHVHISDAAAIPIWQYKNESRLAPGDGIIDLYGFLSNLNAVGYRGKISIEVINDDLKAKPIPKAARYVYEAAAKTVGRFRK